MTIPATAFTPVQIVIRRSIDDPHPRWLEVPGEATAVPELFITPAVSIDDERGRAIEYPGGWCLTHQPTGLALVRHMKPYQYRDLAEKLVGLDWGWHDPDHFRDSDMSKQAALIVRDAQLTEPTSEEHPAYDAWRKGEKGKGNGLKRAAIPMALDFLADLQRCWNRHSFTKRDEPGYVPMDIPDPGSEKGTKPNPEWHHLIIQQVNDFGLAYLMLALHQVDPVVADSAAAMLADWWESGDSIGEWGWEWHDKLLKGEPVKLPGIPVVDLVAHN